nr:MAG TPA: protein of unknown function (DUF948) [Caudoviricetes sp.]
MKSTQFYNFPLWEISDVQPLLDAVNNGTNKVDETMATQQANIAELSKKVETNTDEILQLSNDLTNQVTAFKRLSNTITSFCHKRL